MKILCFFSLKNLDTIQSLNLSPTTKTNQNRLLAVMASNRFSWVLDVGDLGMFIIGLFLFEQGKLRVRNVNNSILYFLT